MLHIDVDIGLLVKMIHDRIEKIANNSLKSRGITLSQARFLEYLRIREGNRTAVQDLENHFEVTHPTTLGILGRLDSKGLITMQTDENDKRRRLIDLTAPGRLLSEEIKVDREQMEKTLTSVLDSSEKKELTRMLSRIMEGLIEYETTD